MISISNEEKSLLNKYRRIQFSSFAALATPFTLPAKLSSQIKLNPFSLSYSAPVCGSGGFSIGSVCSAEVQIHLPGTGLNLRDSILSVSWSVDGHTSHPLFTGTIEDIAEKEDSTTATAYDLLYTYGGRDYTIPEALKSSCTGLDVANDIVGIMGISIEDQTRSMLQKIQLSSGLSQLKDRQTISSVLGMLAALCAGNVIINRDGALTIKRFTKTTYETESYAGGVSREDSDFTPRGVIFTGIPDDTMESGTTDYTAGGDTGIICEVPIATQDMTNNVWSVLSSLKFRPGSYSIPQGLIIEPGDIIRINGVDTAVCDLSMSLDGGCKTRIVSSKGANNKATIKSKKKQMSEMEQDLEDMKQDLYGDENDPDDLGVIGTVDDIQQDLYGDVDDPDDFGVIGTVDDMHQTIYGDPSVPGDTGIYGAVYGEGGVGLKLAIVDAPPASYDDNTLYCVPGEVLIEGAE